MMMARARNQGRGVLSERWSGKDQSAADQPGPLRRRSRRDSIQREPRRQRLGKGFACSLCCPGNGAAVGDPDSDTREDPTKGRGRRRRQPGRRSTSGQSPAPDRSPSPSRSSASAAVRPLAARVCSSGTMRRPAGVADMLPAIFCVLCLSFSINGDLATLLKRSSFLLW